MIRQPSLSAVLATLSIAGLLACGGEVSEGDEPELIELKLGHVGPPGSLFDLTANEFARVVNERLAGRVELTVFGSSQLGGDQVLLQKLKLGTIDISLPSTIMSSIIDAFGLFEMPYLVDDREHMRRIEGAVVWPDLAPLAEPEGYRVIAVWENGFRHVTNNRRPIHRPEDLAGIKLRTPRGVWRVKLFQALGANPTPMAYSEVFVALQTGVMDGQENPLAQMISGRFHEVQDYLSLTGHVYTPAFVTVGAARWDRLPEDVRAALGEIAMEIQAFAHRTAAELDARLLAEVMEAGIEVNESDRESFRAASEPIYREFAASVEGGQGLIERARAAR